LVLVDIVFFHDKLELFVGFPPLHINHAQTELINAKIFRSSTHAELISMLATADFHADRIKSIDQFADIILRRQALAID
jgi:hypothetical protein